MKGFVYKITSPSTDKIYVGSTIKTLKRRFSTHKSDDISSSKIIMSLGNAVIELIEEVEFENKNELRIRERYHIELNRDRCVNIRIPSRTHQEYTIDNADRKKERKKKYDIDNADKIKQYRIDNADRCNEYNKQYCIDNADKRKQYRIDNADGCKEYNNQYYIANYDKLHEKFNCECGGKYIYGKNQQHLKTLIHQNYIASII
tara:strand:+ start:864 stop:1472 length:609 start_codon:yes stop_codon:yes gene_type:complete